jgi:hypothetical protein
MLLKLRGDRENPLPLLFRPLYGIPSSSSHVFRLTVPTSNFSPISKARSKELQKIVAVVPKIEEFIFSMQLWGESTTERKQMGIMH